VDFKEENEFAALKKIQVLWYMTFGHSTVAYFSEGLAG
jgi:hypothetical protein